MLAVTLHQQQKYSEAERLSRRIVRQQEEVLGGNHKDTLLTKDLLQKVILAQAPPAAASPLGEAAERQLSKYFIDGTERQTGFNDLDIQQVSRCLSQVNTQWSKVPRTYILLRTLGCLEILNAFIELGFSDHWLPVTEDNIPHCLHLSKRSKFSLDLEEGAKGQHHNFRPDEPLSFEEKGVIGTGGFGQVDRVLSTISFKEYARKRVPRSAMFGGRRTDDIKQFIAEIEVIKRLEHHHVVEFVGSYTDLRYMALIMSPVAEMDLATYLAKADAAKHRELRTFFGCLSRALEYLHKRGVRHKDIKPSNILVHGGNVLFTDFGLALDFTDAESSTTVGIVNGMSPRYCAPEVANFEYRNTSSDIWSLGIVFLEMTVVLNGRTIKFVDEFLSEHGLRQASVRSNPDGLHELVAELKESGIQADNAALGWIQDMLMTQQRLRPTAATLIASITAVGLGSNEGFCGICCMSLDDPLDEFYEL
ncbi:hypothetical protein LTR73_008994 [Friedmanniomyces endolithicus]|nr:hypothetical protein LTR73_008994 [Friedmanniomyces endolithicus]